MNIFFLSYSNLRTQTISPKRRSSIHIRKKFHGFQLKKFQVHFGYPCNFRVSRNVRFEICYHSHKFYAWENIFRDLIQNSHLEKCSVTSITARISFQEIHERKISPTAFAARRMGWNGEEVEWHRVGKFELLEFFSKIIDSCKIAEIWFGNIWINKLGKLMKRSGTNHDLLWPLRC